MSSAGDAPRPGDRPRPEHPFPAEGRPSGPRPGPHDGPSAFGQAYPPHVYNPYGNVSYPASYPVPPGGTGPAGAEPVRRPGSVTVALVLLILAAVPYLLFGVLFLLATGLTPDMLPAEQRAQLDQAGWNPDEAFRILGVVGGVMLGLALLFVVFAVLAWTGRSWARALVAAMVTGFVLLVVAAFALGATQGTTPDLVSLLVLGSLPALALVGVALLFGSAARAWYAARSARAR